jgi:heme exporter protein C
VFAITAGAFVPLNFIAVRMAEAYTHPRVLSTTGGHMPAEMRFTFIVALIAMALLFTTLWRLELAAKGAAARLRHLRRQVERTAGAARRSGPAQAPPVAAVPARSSSR